MNCKSKNSRVKITMLGTANALAKKCYNTCFVLENEHGKLLVDAGGGNQILSRLDKAGIPLTSLNYMFVTHAHTDHILGCIWIIRMISTAINRGEYTGTFTIYTHDDVAELLELMTIRMLPKKIAKELGNGIKIVRLSDGENAQDSILGMTLTAFSIHSTKLVQFGFMLSDGDYKLTCLGDEPYNAECEKYAKNADILLCEAFCLYEDREIFHPYEKHHSTAMDAAKLATELGVKSLLLYHTEEKTIATRKEKYTAEAKQFFSGDVYVPEDLEVIEGV